MKIFKDKLIFANFISNFFYSFAYPTLNIFLISQINKNFISMNMIIVCLSGIIFSQLWNKKSEDLFKKYDKLLISEMVLYAILIFSVILGFVTPKMYYIIDTLFFAIISKNIICGNNRLKVLLYKDHEREEFDNNLVIASNASSLIGYLLSFIFNLNINIAFVFMFFGITLDNIFLFNVYNKRCKDKNIESVSEELI